MKPTHILLVATLFTVSLTLTACSQPADAKITLPSNDEKTTPQSNLSNSAPQPVAGSATKLSDEDLHQKAIANLSDARLYCLGMMLYAEKHGNMFPTNLDQTLPYLTAPDRPTGTNHFEILYHGSIAQLPNPMTNGIILLRSDAWQKTNGTWARVYGFADGHCETRFEPDGNFTAWEKQNSLNP
jgi:hypothetical protein